MKQVEEIKIETICCQVCSNKDTPSDSECCSQCDSLIFADISMAEYLSLKQEIKNLARWSDIDERARELVSLSNDDLDKVIDSLCYYLDSQINELQHIARNKKQEVM